MPPKASTSFDQAFAQGIDTHIPVWTSTSYTTVPARLSQLEAIKAVLKRIQQYQNPINHGDVPTAAVNRCTTISFIEGEDSDEDVENDTEQAPIEPTDPLLPAVNCHSSRATDVLEGYLIRS
jgi:hypothetical protein